MAAAVLPLKNNQPYGNLDHHIHRARKRGTGQHHNIESYDQETIWPSSINFAHKPCSFCHQPEANVQQTRTS